MKNKTRTLLELKVPCYQLMISLILIFLMTGCASGWMQSNPTNLDWAYQHEDRRLNFKSVHIVRQNGRKVITGTVENVGEEDWPAPTIHFALLNQSMKVIGTVSTSRTKPLNVGAAWDFVVTPDNTEEFHRARFREPTGWYGS